jgi:hypothetical protein
MQVVLDERHHRHYLTARRRNPSCRLGDHATWTIEGLSAGPEDLTLGDVFAIARRRFGTGDQLGLAVEGKRFARELSCVECGRPRRLLRLAAALRPSDNRCPHCGGGLAVTGFGLVERLDAAGMPQRRLDRSLHGLGLRPGEVVTLSSRERELHVEIGAVAGRERA